MKEVVASNAFKRDIKRLSKRNYPLSKLGHILTLLQTGQSLPPSTRPHILNGEWKGVWECHIAPDWLLIYEITETEISLFRTGTHADLFE
jgi:mRNA interferase YafQ